MDGFGDDHAHAQAAHTALMQIREQLNRHPMITHIEGLPNDTLYSELRAAVEPVRVGVEAPSGTLTVRWFVPTADGAPRFVFHFADATGFDCGWHYHEQDHVTGLGHYQERITANEPYEYEPYSFESTEPARIVWIICDELVSLFNR